MHHLFHKAVGSVSQVAAMLKVCCCALERRVADCDRRLVAEAVIGRPKVSERIG